MTSKNIVNYFRFFEIIIKNRITTIFNSQILLLIVEKIINT